MDVFTPKQIDGGCDRKAKEKWIRRMKINAAVCLGIGLVIATTFMMCYWNLFAHATSYNKTLKAMPTTDPNFPGADIDYDNCVDITSPYESTLRIETMWRFVFHFNAWFYTIMSCVAVLGFLGLFKFSLFRPAICCLNVSSAFHIAAIALAGVASFNPAGILCSLNNNAYDADGNSFYKDGQTFRTLFVAQICLIIPMCCCSCCGMFMG